MREIFLARQAITNLSGDITAYELLFRDAKDGIMDMPSAVSATAKLLYNAINYMDLNTIIGENQTACINCDHTVISAGFVDLLNPVKFSIELLETTEITDDLIRRIRLLKDKGFRFSIDDFDCTKKMYIKFLPILQYVSVVKVCIHEIDVYNCEICLDTLKKWNVNLLAEKVETKQEYEKCVELGFTYFQGYYISKPETIQETSYSDVSKIMIIKVIKNIQENSDIDVMVSTFKSYPEMLMQLFRFVNNKFPNTNITSVKHAIQLIGTKDLTRWCLIHFHANMTGFELSDSMSNIAISRANDMVGMASSDVSSKAYLVGLISALSHVYKIQNDVLIKNISLDKDVHEAIIDNTGYFGELLTSVIKMEQLHLWDVIHLNKEKLTTEKMICLIDSMKLLK